MPLTPFQFPFNGRPNEIGLPLRFLKDRRNPGQRPGREPSGCGFFIYAFSAHLPLKKDDITY